MRQKAFVWVSSASLVLSAAGLGCQNSGGGRTIDQDQSQTVQPDGTAVQTRTRTRETPSGTTVRETETRQREVVDPGGATNPDPTKEDPGAGQ